MSKTHCKRGHEFSPENTYEYKKRRCCKACKSVRESERYAADPEYFKKRNKSWKTKNKDKERQYALHSLYRNKYGIEPEEVERLRALQDNRCAICFEVFQKTPFVDHCHRTQKIRGLLCTICNSGIGMFKDNVDRLESAIKYLSKGLADGVNSSSI